MLPKHKFPQAKLLNVLRTILGNLIARSPAAGFLLRKFDAVDFILAFQILQCGVGWDVASPDTTGYILPVNGQD